MNWLGNDDDPPPPGYNHFTWFLRNPFHNFFFYVVGVVGKGFPYFSTHPLKLTLRGDIGERGWVFGAHRVRAWLWLPFVSYSGALWFYIGWRPSGALGAKLTRPNP